MELAVLPQRRAASSEQDLPPVLSYVMSLPTTPAERDACLKFVRDAESPERGYQGVLWGLLNTREFLLQH